MLKYDLNLDVDYELYEEEEFLASSSDLLYIIAEYNKYSMETPDSYFSLVEVTRKDVTDKLVN